MTETSSVMCLTGMQHSLTPWLLASSLSSSKGGSKSGDVGGGAVESVLESGKWRC